VEQRYDVFISYTGEDRTAVDVLVAALRRDSFTVWIDVDNIRIGMGAPMQLADVIDASRHMIACLSDAYVAKPYTMFELQNSLARDPAGRSGRTLPVLIGPLSRGIPASVRHLIWCDLTDPAQYEQQYKLIVQNLAQSDGERPSAAGSGEVERTALAAFDRLDDPRQTLFNVRHATVALTKHLHRDLIGDPPAGLTPDALIELLLVSGRLPEQASTPLAVLYAFGRQAMHDRTDTVPTREIAAPAVNALRALTDWMFPEQRAQYVWSEIWNRLPVGSSLTERCIPDTPYRIREPQLSCNSLGPLYAGVDTKRHEPVSINLVTLPADTHDRFFEDVGRFLRLNAANIISPRDAGPVVVDDVRECLYLVLPAFYGTDLRGLVERHGALPTRAAYELALEVATALVGYHEADPPIVHGDLKPTSILISDFGTVGVLCIGHQVASAPTAALSQNAEGRVDSFHFASPEQRYGRPLTPVTDLHALRVVLAYALTGKHPATLLPAPEIAPVDALDDGVADRAVLDRLVTCHTAVETCRVLREAVRAAPAGATDLRSLVGPRRSFARDQPQEGRLRLVDVCPMSARLAWPFCDEALLVWDRADDTLALLRGMEMAWRDDRPMPVRTATAGVGGRLAVGGWNGDVRCFRAGELVATAMLDGTVGDLQYAQNVLLVGAWNRALRSIADDGTETRLLRVERGVHRIAVSDRGDRFAVADQSGSLMIYADGRRVLELPSLGPVAGIAYAGSRLVVLTDEAVAGVRLDGTRSEPVDLPGAFDLRRVVAAAQCLLLSDPAGAGMQAWRIDEAERRLASFTLAAGESLVSLSATADRCTVALPSGGCAYRRHGAEVLAWPDAVSAQVSYDGRRVAVVHPDRVELFEDLG
jgi:eukaryotic-like serine/threonine-protein kinase